MNPSPFLQYPEYLSLFLIWASGYVFNHILFGKSKSWRSFDSTIKLIFGFISGFAIELCIILPFFYMFVPNAFLTPPSLLAIQKTWMLHAGFSLCTSLIILQN